ncbi:hypothetical protein ADO06_01989 [Streptococcus parauberis]|nr:hypothetical protein ADO06_01989 [Streptococcus parauberis]
MIKLLKKLIFAKEEPKQEKWTIQHTGWEQSKNNYNKGLGLGETLI